MTIPSAGIIIPISTLHLSPTNKSSSEILLFALLQVTTT
jgi:hypothetical protein